MLHKKTEKESGRRISHWEEVWTSEDYTAHESTFREMLKELKVFQDRFKGDINMAQNKWLEKQGVAKVKEYMGHPELYVTSVDLYPIEVAKLSKLSEWLAFQESKRPDYAEFRKSQIGKLEHLTALGKMKKVEPSEKPEPVENVPPAEVVEQPPSQLPPEEGAELDPDLKRAIDEF